MEGLTSRGGGKKPEMGQSPERAHRPGAEWEAKPEEGKNDLNHSLLCGFVSRLSPRI